MKINLCEADEIRHVRGVSHVRANKIIHIRGVMHGERTNLTRDNLKQLRLGFPDHVLDSFDYEPLFKTNPKPTPISNLPDERLNNWNEGGRFSKSGGG